MSTPQKIIELVEDFKENKYEYINPDVFDEENTKVKFLNPFFEALGWNVRNEGLSARFREVVFEDSIKVGKKTKAPDYSFRLGGERIFFVEAKKPSRDIANDKEHAFQVRRYGWSAKLPLCILTDFEELAIYDTTIKPDKNQSASIGRIKYYKYTEYIEKWDEIYDIFSKDAVLSGKFDNYANNVKHDKKGTTEIDDEFLKEIEEWRLLLARNIALRNPELSIEDLNYAVQLTIDRIIFLRIAEDRGIERYGRLYDLLKKEEIYKNFTKICKEADQKYNSGLFHFNPYDKEDFTTDTYTLDLDIDDKVFKEIFKNLYYPNSPYEFSLISTEILGKIYEQFLGKVIRLTPSHQAKVEDKPEVKKAGGVYYTPQYIVDYIVKNTLGEKIKGLTPNQISKIRVIDPACGSGSFLIRAYQYLLNYHLDYYSNLERPPKDVIYTAKDGINRLTIKEKKRILKNNIYGVDLDTLAVEVTKLSLLLKVLEDQNKDQLEAQQKLFHERVLPNLGSNIKNGNSLIASDILEQQDLTMDEIKEIKPFDWKEEYPEIFEEGGFDVVIGNPPYVNISNISKKQKELLKNNYDSAYKRFDLYVLFIEKSLNILNEKGLHGLIIPDKICNQKYALNIRKILLNKTNLESIVDLRKFKIFKKATVSNIIYICSKGKIINNKFNIIKPKKESIENEELNGELIVTEQNFYENTYENMFRLDLTINKFNLCKKIEKKSIFLNDIAYCSFGFQPGNLKKFTFNKESEPEKYDENNNCIKKFIRGRNINKYYIDFTEDYVFYIPNKLHRPAFPQLFDKPKIMLSEISTDIIATIDYDKFYGNEKTINILLWKDMKSVDEKIIKKRGIKFTEENVYLSNNYPLESIVTLLNSKLLNFYFKMMISDDINVYPDNVRHLPIYKNFEKLHEMTENGKKITKLINEVNCTNTPTERKLIQQQIDITDKKINELVYKLYDLTEDEIQIIEDNI